MFFVWNAIYVLVILAMVGLAKFLLNDHPRWRAFAYCFIFVVALLLATL